MSLPWVRLDTNIATAPEVLVLVDRYRDGHRTMLVHIFAVCWAATNDADGVITPLGLRESHGRPRDAGRLVDVGLWEPTGNEWLIVDWLEHVQPDRRAHIPAALRRAVYDRDGHACRACGSTERLSLDHVVHWSRGGQDTLQNLRTLCQPCNSARRARTDAEWLGMDI